MSYIAYRTSDEVANVENKVFFRTNRIIRADSAYYFLTREGTQEGPFDTLDETEIELMFYIRHQRRFGQS